MKQLIVMLALVLGVGLSTASCKSTKTSDSMGAQHLCDDCGQVKGADECCAADAMTCSGCELAKGSPGCCKMEKGGGDVALCADCGQIKGSEACCDPAAMKCSDCGMAKGSPACCM